LETVIAGVGSRGELPSPPFSSLSLSLSLHFSPCACPLFLPCARAPSLPPLRACAPALPARRRRGPAPLLARRARPPPPPLSARRAPALPCSRTARPRLPCSRGVAPWHGPQRGAAQRGPGTTPGTASRPSAWLAWPRAPPFTPNTFPRAQPHARGVYSWFLVSFKLR
jgi:hypothetical protein